MAALQSSDAMSFCVFLLCSGLPFTTGCTGEYPLILCSPGESVLLPCINVNPQITDVQWWFSDFSAIAPQFSVFPEDSSETQRYKDRVQVHRNHSLSISRLTLEDRGSYWCKFKTWNHREFISLFVQGCSLSGNGESVEISRYSGGSVFLSCSVTCSPNHKPVSEFRWRLPDNREIKHTNTVDFSRRSKFTTQGFGVNPYNLSLLISNLTEKDEGLYSCWFQENQHKSFRLTVKGCRASEAEGKAEVKYPGESVLLSCSCKDPQSKPEQFRWSRVDSSGTEVSIEDSRVQTFHRESPSNLSLLISSLTEEDQGTYRCSINNRTNTTTRLTVKGCDLSEYPQTQSSSVGGSVTLPCSCEDPKTKPKRSEWKRADGNETLVSENKDTNGRFQMIRDSPHDFSLKISNLTEADGGLYVCAVSGGKSRSVTLTVTDFVSTNRLLYLTVMMMMMVLVFTMAACFCWIFTTVTKEGGGGRSLMMLKPDPELDETYTTVVYSQADF